MKYVDAVEFYKEGRKQASMIRATPLSPSVRERLCAAEEAFEVLLAEKLSEPGTSEG